MMYSVIFIGSVVFVSGTSAALRPSSVAILYNNTFIDIILKQNKNFNQMPNNMDYPLVASCHGIVLHFGRTDLVLK